MTATNFEHLTLKAQFRELLCMLMDIHDKKPCDIYRHTKHKYKFIKNTLTKDENHRFDTVEELMLKFGYKIIIHIERIPGAKILEF